MPGPPTCPEICACVQVQPECCDEPRWLHQVGTRHDYYVCLLGQGCNAP